METPNYVAMYASAVDTGRAQARQRAVQNALAKASEDPSMAQQELLRYGALNEANTVGRLAQQQRQRKVQQDIAPDIAKGDYAGARNKAITGGDYELAKQLDGLNDARLKQLDKNNQILGGISYNLGQVPDMAQREQLWKATAPRLIEMGVLTPEQAAAVDISDIGLRGYQTDALTVKEQIDLAFKRRQQEHTENKDKTDAERADKRLDWDIKHGTKMEGIAGQNAATSAYSAQTGRMSYEARKAAGGFGTPGAGNIIGTTLPEGWEQQ